MHDRPVVVLDPDGLYDPLREQVRVLVERGFVCPASAPLTAWRTQCSPIGGSDTESEP